MQNLIKGLLKWIGAGIGIGIGIIIVFIAIQAWDSNRKATTDDISVEQDNDSTNPEPEDEWTVVPSELDDQEVPTGYKRIESGSIMLDAPIMGMEWESAVDENITTDPRVYEPFTLYSCITDDGEQLRLDVVNSDIGYMLKFYFGIQGQELALEAQQAAEDAHYAIHTNAVTLVMRDPDTYYALTRYEDGNTAFYIKNAMTGHEINHFFCEETPDSMDNIAFINQMEPEHFKFKPMTDELDEILSPQSLK